MGLRIPKTLAQEAHMKEGSPVDLRAERGRLVMRPVQRYRLADLLAAVTRTNRHAEVDTGARVGREAW